jgi:hypothetical protein
MQTFLIALSSILVISSIVPYLRDIVRGKTRPRVVTWFTWALLTGISCVAALSDHAYTAAILLLAETIGPLLVVVLSLKHGDRTFERFDIICQVGALVGLVLWLVLDSPAIAVLANVCIDAIGALPTFKHTWQKPYEETWVAYFGGSVGAICTLLATTNWRITTAAYPFYLVVGNGALAAIILVRGKYAVHGTPPKDIREPIE